MKVPSRDYLVDLASQHNLVFRDHFGYVLSPWKEDADIEEYLISYSRALLAQCGHPTVPEGWQLVPTDATRSMIDAAKRVEEDGYAAMHTAMLEAAPKFGD